MTATPLVVHTFSEGLPLVPPAEVAANTGGGGNTVQNGPTVWLEMTNGSGSSATVTVAYAQTVDGHAVAPRVYTLAASAKLRAGFFPSELFGDTISVTASVNTVTLAAYQLAR